MHFTNTLRVYLGAALAAATAAGCAVKVNGSGKPSHPGGGGGGEVVEPGPDVYEDTYEAAYAAAQTRKPPDRPADPWSAVDGDQPRVVAKRQYDFASTTPNDCSAAHDHCLPADIWFVENHDHVDDLQREFQTEHFHGIDPDNKFDDSPYGKFGHAGDPGGEDIAYRTVPATRRHLVKGALALALPYPARVPASEEDATTPWWGGIVASVDWDAGKVRLVGHKTPYWISATRVAVLRWIPGGKVEVLGKLGKTELAVTDDETIAPTPDTGSIADPWAEVDKKGQPREPSDSEPLDVTSGARSCDAAHDHCLRPWVWFAEDSRGAWPVRFHDGAFHSFTDVDDLGDARTGAAYRTRPADPAKLVVGTRVYFRSTLPASESDAHWPQWNVGDVAEVQPEAGVFRVDGDDEYYPLAAARVRVVMWFPGEKAEKAD